MAASPIAANAAARTVRADIEPVARIQQATGLDMEVATFIGSSPIRQYAENWDVDRILASTRDAIGFAVGEGLEVMYVTEDTTRSRPRTLARLFSAAVEAGAGGSASRTPSVTRRHTEYGDSYASRRTSWPAWENP